MSSAFWGASRPETTRRSLHVSTRRPGAGPKPAGAGKEAASGARERAKAEESEIGGAPRVYFISPKDGDTVKSPVTLEFGHENFKIEPKGDVHAGAGHHHVGVVERSTSPVSARRSP